MALLSFLNCSESSVSDLTDLHINDACRCIEAHALPLTGFWMFRQKKISRRDTLLWSDMDACVSSVNVDFLGSSPSAAMFYWFSGSA